jgi:putative Ca2+/H+ antiporter (TMEM165/GDT1 family)
MLYDAAAGGGAGEAELAEVEKELAAGSSAAPNGKSGGEKDPKARREGGAGGLLARILSPVLLEAFALTFMAEWGDRSQIATIGLAAASDVWGVAAGGVLGHALCTGAAVLGGKHLATHIDERMVAAAGGLLFLVFGAHAAWIGVPE